MERALGIAAHHLIGAPRLEPRNQTEETLDRIAAGKGAPVELFRIQNDASGLGFCAQFGARKHELVWRYGFVFGHRQERERSWHWLELEADGKKPRLNPVPIAEPKGGAPASSTPSPSPASTPSPATTSGDSQPSLFPPQPAHRPHWMEQKRAVL
ncbi:MAG: hypothetical protein LAP21_26090 [Acidobacteriia bacterium]|nr:hypothetical protein [Terriglobia bacterium]